MKQHCSITLTTALVPKSVIIKQHSTLGIPFPLTIEFHEHCAMVQMPDEWGARVPNKAGLRRLYVSSEKTDWGTVESGLVF